MTVAIQDVTGDESESIRLKVPTSSQFFGNHKCERAYIPPTELGAAQRAKVQSDNGVRMGMCHHNGNRRKDRYRNIMPRARTPRGMWYVYGHLSMAGRLLLLALPFPSFSA